MGIGRAYAERLASEGAAIACVDRASSAETVGVIEKAGGKAAAFTCDVGDPAAVGRTSAAVLERFGRCDILINNAGIFPVQGLDEISYEDWRRVMAINLDAPFLFAKAFAPGMRQRQWGRIINQASDTVQLVLTGFTHYIASKNGLIGLTRALATELGNDGVTVNAIAPGLTQTPGTDAKRDESGAPSRLTYEAAASHQAIKRPLTPDDYCGTVSFLCTDGAAMLTGQTFYVNGGHTRN
jgi:NAD(P)-dependent dehydrogenase (short-subunit alcohol dehydrogenase family)